MSSSSGLTRGEVAARTGVGIETVRFYEKEGLLEDPPRTSSGYRQYPEEVVSRLHFIRRAKELGFSLREVRDLISLRLDSSTDCNAVQEKAEAKLGDIRAKIRDLKALEAGLEELVAACRRNSTQAECPLLDMLGPVGRE